MMLVRSQPVAPRTKRVVSGERLAFQAGTGDFEHLRPLQVVEGNWTNQNP